MSARIAIVGAAGQLAAAVAAEARCRGHQVAPFTRADFDVTDAAAARRVLTGSGAGVIVNCTADNAVDAAEASPAGAFAVNAFAVRALARIARDMNAVFVHYSTDFVFDGRATQPYREDDDPNPLSVYGLSKLAGEQAAAAAPRHYVLRVESLFGRAPGGPPAKGTIAAMTRSLGAGQSVRVFADRIVSPTSVLDAARATLLLVEGNAPAGIYHCASGDSCTWVALAEYLAAVIGKPASLIPVGSGDVVLPAARPRYCALSTEKLRAAGIPTLDWRSALSDALPGILSGS